MPQKPWIVVIGTSAGGVAALQTFVDGLSSGLNAAVFIVQHTGPDSPGLLPGILQSDTVLPVRHAVDKEDVAPGRIYVAPPDRHLIVVPDRVLVTRGPKEHFTRPAIDPLFRSAALAYGPAVIGVILSGMLDDGTAGLWAVKQRGGIAVVQNPNDAKYPGMPMSALRYVAVDHCVRGADIGPLIQDLTRESSPGVREAPMSKEIELETRIAKGEQLSPNEVLQLGDPSPFTCPECHGALLQLKDAGIVRFRCHAGHAYSVQSLLEEVDTEVETNLWNAIRTLEESSLLLEHFAKHLDEIGAEEPRAALFRQKSAEAEHHAAVIRDVATGQERLSLGPSTADEPKGSS